VFNAFMTRLLAAAAALLGFALAAAPASARIIELGVPKTPLVSPTCPSSLPPSQCTIILTRATALETIRDGFAYPTTVKTAGQIVAFTVGLSALTSDRATRKSYIHSLDTSYGGTTQLAITVLRPVGPKKFRRWQVVGESTMFHVQPFLGQVVQFPLTTSLSVQRGDTIALTTPTWAPVLSILQSTKKFAYRQSRKANCNNPPATDQAQLTPGQSAPYQCDYPGTRVEYSATEVTTPVPPKDYVHSGRRPAQRQHHRSSGR
jgi:hypothetical protein